MSRTDWEGTGADVEYEIMVTTADELGAGTTHGAFVQVGALVPGKLRLSHNPSGVGAEGLGLRDEPVLADRPTHHPLRAWPSQLVGRIAYKALSK